MQPYFHSLSEFIAMGKHGVYVWACWGMVFMVIIGLIIHSRQQRKRLLRKLKQQQKYKRKRQNQRQQDQNHSLKK